MLVLVGMPLQRQLAVRLLELSLGGVPPNLDLPDGTVWRLDVDYREEALSSGIQYGSEPMGAFQYWPDSGQAPQLTSGQTYFLYVLADIYVPLTRCLFTAP